MKGVALAALIILASCLGASGAASAKPTKKARHPGFSGEVLYDKPACPDSAQTHPAPMPGAEIWVDPPGPGQWVDEGKISASGKVSFKLAKPTAKVYAELEGDRITVRADRRPKNAAPSTPAGYGPPYRISLGTWRKGVPRRKLLHGPEAGAANIWTVLNHAADVAARVTYKKLPHVDAYWRYNPNLVERDAVDLDASYYLDTTQQIFVHDSGLVDFTLEHEYGHHLLAINDPFKDAGGDHAFTEAQPDKPGLAWSEGFAHAFSAIVDRDPVRSLTCRARANLSTHPITPAPTGYNLIHSQYVEGPVAGAVWDLTKVLGDGKRTAGLKKLVAAVAQYPPHPARSVSNVFDALLAAGLGSTPERFEAIRGAFAGQNIGYGTAIGGVDMAADTHRGSLAPHATQLTLSAPGSYATCTVHDSHAQSTSLPGVPFQWYGTIGASGGLPATWQDDCLVRGGDGSTPDLGEASSQTGALWIMHPYLADQSHLGTGFTVSVRWTCTNDQGDYDQTGDDAYLCPKDDVPLNVEVGNGILDDQPSSTDSDLPGAFVNSPDVGDVTVPVDAVSPLLRFDSQGHCEVIPTHTDCGD